MRFSTAAIAAFAPAVAYGVDYRVPPDGPYPAALDDCISAYRALLAEVPAERIVVSGTSAGGNLAGALLLRARDEGLAMPAGALLLTPELDLTESGDSFDTLMGLDVVLSARLMEMNLVYAGGADLAHPYLSPLFGDIAGFPPTLLQAGTRDLFLSNAVRMHRRLRSAGVRAELHVWEGMRAARRLRRPHARGSREGQRREPAGLHRLALAGLVGHARAPSVEPAVEGEARVHELAGGRAHRAHLMRRPGREHHQRALGTGLDVEKAVRIADRVQPQRAAGETLRLAVEVVDAADDADLRALGPPPGVDVAAIEGAVAVRDELQLDRRGDERRHPQIRDQRLPPCRAGAPLQQRLELTEVA